MNVLRFLRWMRQRGWTTLLYGRRNTTMFRRAEEYEVPTVAFDARSGVGKVIWAPQLAGCLKRDNVRWLIVHQSQDLLAGSVARRLAGRHIKLIYHQHMHIGGDKKDFYHRRLYEGLDAFVTPIQWLADRVMEKTTIDPARLHVIPRGIELQRYIENYPDKKEARARFEVPQDGLIIGVVGRLDPKKGQHVAIEALARLHREGRRAHLMLVGNRTHAEANEYVNRVHRMVSELELTEFVHFREHDPDPRWAYAALDIFALTSKSECYGMVTIEALTCGLPVVATADGGTLSLIRHGENGWLVRPLDADDLARSLAHLIDNPELASRLAAEGRRWALATFSHHDQCGAWERLLEVLS